MTVNVICADAQDDRNCLFETSALFDLSFHTLSLGDCVCSPAAIESQPCDLSLNLVKVALAHLYAEFFCEYNIWRIQYNIQFSPKKENELQMLQNN